MSNKDIKVVFKELGEYWSFKRYIASELAKQVWYLQVMLSIVWLIFGDAFSLITRAIIVVVWLILARLWTEFFIVLFNIAEHLLDIRKRLQEGGSGQ